MNVVSLSERNGGGPRIPGSRPTHVAALDIGSTKISCLIAKVAGARSGGPGPDRRQLQVLGIGHKGASGIKAGSIVDMDAAEFSIRAAVDAAERMANVTVEHVFVNVSGGRPMCQGYSAKMGLEGPAVEGDDIRELLHLTHSHVDPGSKIVIHTTPVGYSLDGTSGIRNPENMFGETLGVDLNVITADPGPMRNLAVCVERCHLGVDGFVIAPYASGISTLVEDEKDLGVTCIDMGGGTTSVSIFFEGNMVFADALPVGGQHVTADIARGLSTSTAHAERMKALFGSALPSASDEREIIAVPLVGEHGTDTVNKIPKSMLTGIIQPRLEETLELVRDRIRGSGFEHLGGRRVVLTGGASQMNGLRVLAGSVLDKQVRMGTPQGVVGLPDTARGPSFSVVAGLLRYALNPDVDAGIPVANRAAGFDAGYFRRVGQWIKESF